MATIKNIVLDLIDYINNQETSITNSLIMGFDLLDTNKNSICLSLSDTDKAGEGYADVTGRFIEGIFDLSIYYRDISGVEGISDLDSYDFLNTLAKYIKTNYTYKVINNEVAEWVEEIKIKRQAKMSKIYDGNIKDYVVELEIKYVYLR